MGLIQDTRNCYLYKMFRVRIWVVSGEYGDVVLGFYLTFTVQPMSWDEMRSLSLTLLVSPFDLKLSLAFFIWNNSLSLSLFICVCVYMYIYNYIYVYTLKLLVSNPFNCITSQTLEFIGFPKYGFQIQIQNQFLLSNALWCRWGF